MNLCLRHYHVYGVSISDDEMPPCSTWEATEIQLKGKAASSSILGDIRKQQSKLTLELRSLGLGPQLCSASWMPLGTLLQLSKPQCPHLREMALVIGSTSESRCKDRVTFWKEGGSTRGNCY